MAAMFLHGRWSPRPPLGWNSYDCFGSDVTESEVRANAEFMARHLRVLGWEYVVVDFCWSHPAPGVCANPNIGRGCQPLLHTDLHGRLVPAPNRFPSAGAGAGFRPLADFVHALGLKFGIHMMRGIPRQVSGEHTAIDGSPYTTHQASTQRLECPWLDHMDTVNMEHPAGQAYYDSVFRLYASWGVDYVKVDDAIADGTDSATGPYHAAEIEGIRLAIDRCGRPMLLSLSPGDAPLGQAGHLLKYANLWRISADFWDDWRKLKRMFTLCEQWWPHRDAGAWPDADMLPLGRLCKRGPKMPERDSRLSPAQARVMLSLWSIFRSPLMIGGHLPETDEATLELLCNPEVIEVNQTCRGGRPLETAAEGLPVWISEYPKGGDIALAAFNLTDEPVVREVACHRLGMANGARVRDLWTRSDRGETEGALVCDLATHSVVFWRLSPR